MHRRLSSGYGYIGAESFGRMKKDNMEYLRMNSVYPSTHLCILETNVVVTMRSRNSLNAANNVFNDDL